MIVSAFTWLCKYHHHHLQNTFHHCTETLPPLNNNSPLHLLPVPGNPMLLSVSHDLTTSGTSCKWNHANGLLKSKNTGCHSVVLRFLLLWMLSVFQADSERSKLSTPHPWATLFCGFLNFTLKNNSERTSHWELLLWLKGYFLNQVQYWVLGIQIPI